MNWKVHIQQFDQAALEDLTNAGLIRRAKKLCDAAKVLLVEDSQESGKFSVTDHTVYLFTDFPHRLNCDCKGSGICVHTLAAVFSAQADDSNANPDGDKAVTDEEMAMLRQELLAISQQEIFKWAGKTGRKQAGKVLAAYEGEQPQCLFDAKSVEIVFDDEVRCRYVAGGGLAGVICNSPDSRRKGIVAACMLGLRLAEGEDIDLPVSESNKIIRLSSDDIFLLNDIKSKLTHLLQTGLMHSTNHQVHALRTLAWSARGESFPRVSAMILHLAGVLVEYQHRSGRVDTSYLLDAVSRLWIECDALLNAGPQQLDNIKGQTRRHYTPRDIGKLWISGASQYTTLSGAKGVSLVAWDISDNTPYRVNIGRTAQTASSLDTQNVWGLVLPWQKSASIQQMAGQVISLSHVRVSEDNRISLSKETVLNSIESCEFYTSEINPLGFQQWTDVLSALESDISSVTPLFRPMLIKPKTVYAFEIDEYSQQWESWAQDGDGRLVKMNLPVSNINNDRVKRINKVLTHYAGKIWGIVLEPQYEGTDIALSPQSLILRDNNTWLCFSPDFEFFQKQKYADFLSRFINKLAKAHPFAASPSAVSNNTLAEMPALTRIFHQIDDFILGAAELGLDCQVENRQTINDIVKQLKLANASYLSGSFERLDRQCTTHTLLMAYFVFVLAIRRLNLQHMIRTN